MTIWARRSLFREHFDMDKWELSVEEHDDYIVFTTELKEGEAVFDLESFGFNDLIDTITIVGQDSAELVISEDFSGFRVEVPRESLPEDYMD